MKTRIKYNGWVIKGFYGLLAWTFEERRQKVIADWGGIKEWRRTRREGEHKLVKVKLVEVEE